MDKRSKIVVFSLIGVALVFFLGVGAGFVPRDDDEPEPTQYRPGGGMEFMDWLLSAFSPRWRPSTFRYQPGCAHEGSTIRLSSVASTCTITIPAIDEEFQKGTVRIDDQRVAVRQFACTQDSQADRGAPAMAAGSTMRLKKARPAFALKQPIVVGGTVKAASARGMVDVIYAPEGEIPSATERQDPRCWLKQTEPIRLVLLGGEKSEPYRLILTCKNCKATASDPVQVILE